MATFKKIIILSVIFLLINLANAGIFNSFVFAKDSAKEAHEEGPYPARVEVLSSDTYFIKVREAIKNAEGSIDMAMYLVSFNPEDNKSAVSKLVQELIEAHKRGVKVRVILDQNIYFTGKREKSQKWERQGKNDALFVYLRQQGIEAYYDNPFVLTHGKIIIVDKKIVILGSNNWSESSLIR
ncbi:MAG: phospholipase D-like domain-containing protein, partial [Candidatus Omnitrophota bacterium]